mgnify:CR=1 FL=1
MGTLEALSLAMGTAWASGINLYATVATLGIAGRAEMIKLPPDLQVLMHPAVIAVACIMYVIEFFADKIPAFDLIWNALHTFVRVPVAALLAYGAAAHLPPAAQVISAVAGGTIALAAHGGKIAARAAVTPSPEPFSNMALSVGEDVIAVGISYLALQHPVIASVVAIALPL